MLWFCYYRVILIRITSGSGVRVVRKLFIWEIAAPHKEKVISDFQDTVFGFLRVIV